MKKSLFVCLLVLISTIGGASRAHAQAQWNTNLLQNTLPTGSSQFTGWEVRNGGSDGWAIDNGWFKSSYSLCVLEQIVTLADYGFTASDISGKQLYASVNYEVPLPGSRSRGRCIIKIGCIGENGTILNTLYLLNMVDYRNVEIPPTTKDSTFTLPAGTLQLRYELYGRDQVNWRGQAGPRFSNMVLMITDGSVPTYTASVDPAMGDSITLSKTSGIQIGDSITVTATYPEHPILYMTLNGESPYKGNKVVCSGRNMVVGAHLSYPHAITLNASHATLTANQTSAYVGDTITLTHSMETGYFFIRYTTSTDVQWVGSDRFIMPEEAIEIGMEVVFVNAVPFFEGFESGNMQDSVVQGWTQQKETGLNDNTWAANQNSEYNTAPFQGAWNAKLLWGNTQWLFRWFQLEAGKIYRLGMYARQNESNSNYASLSAYIGSAQDKDAMQTVIIPETGLTNGDYQLLADTFSVAQSGAYALGIRGMIDSNPWYMSLDNITLGEYITHTVRTTDSEYSSTTLDKTEAYAGDTVRVTATVSEGYILDSLHTAPSVVWLDGTHFIMPDADVVLTAYTHKAQTGVLHIINTDKASLHILRDGVELLSGSAITEGETLCSVAVAGPGYELQNLSPNDTTCAVVAGKFFVNDTLVMDASGITVQWIGLTPRVQCPDSTTAVVTWDSIGCEYDVLITDKEVTNFTFQKGIRHTDNAAYTMQGLTAGRTYYAYLRANKAGEEEIWNSRKFFMLPTEAGESCTLIIHCYDSYSDGWTGNALRLEENGQITRFTLENGSSATFTYLTQSGTIAIYWEKGSYPQEASFSIATADGDILAEASTAAGLKDGEQLFYGNPCNICAQPVITRISHQGSDITVSWANTGAASYHVALLNKGTATDEELATLQVSTTDTTYTFHNMDTCKFYMAYLQAQCSDKEVSPWVNGVYMAQQYAKPQWQPITLNYHAKGDLITDGQNYANQPTQCLLYRLSLTEKQTVAGSSDILDMVLLPMFDNDSVDMSKPHDLSDTITLEPGNYGIIAFDGGQQQYDYEIAICKVDSILFTPITVPYQSDTLTNDKWCATGGYAQGFEFTLDIPTMLEICMNGLAWDDESSYMDLYRYENGVESLVINEFDRGVSVLDSGTYHLVVKTFRTDVTYTVSVAAPQTLAFDTIVPDTLLTGTISTDGSLYPLNAIMVPGKAYTFTLQDEQTMNILLYATQADSVTALFYTDSLCYTVAGGLAAVGTNDSSMCYAIRNRHGSEQRYYMVVYNFTRQEQSFTCALHTCSDPDSVSASDTMHVAEPKMITLDAHSNGIFDTNKSMTGTYDAYTIHLEKDKQYRFYAEAPATASEMDIYVLDPARKEGLLFYNSITWSNMIPDYHTAIVTASVDEGKDYTFMLNATAPLKLNDEPQYLLACEEMLSFDSLIRSAQEVVLPFRQDTAFGKAKYAGDDSWNWHPIYDYFSSFGIYSAAAYMVQVNAGDTLYASLTTDHDAVIHFFRFYDMPSTTNPVVIDMYEGYPQIAEKGMYVNQSDSVETIVVVASDNNYRPGNSRYNLILSRSLSDIVEKTAIAEASQSVIYCEPDMSIVRDILSRLTLTAKDESGVVIATIDNHALYWDIEFTAGVATYEVNQADLIPGYIFRQTHISVSLRTPEVVFPMADKSSVGLTEFTESAAREALSKLVLTAVDVNGKTVHTFTNVAADWTIDLITGLATYTLRSEYLPEQYKFDETTVAISVQLLSTAVDNAEGANTLLVYPNPANDYIFVEGATDAIRIYDLTGRLVLSQMAETGKTMLNIAALPAGVYSVQSAGQTTLLIVR